MGSQLFRLFLSLDVVYQQTAATVLLETSGGGVERKHEGAKSGWTIRNKQVYLAFLVEPLETTSFPPIPTNTDDFAAQLLACLNS